MAIIPCATRWEMKAFSTRLFENHCRLSPIVTVSLMDVRFLRSAVISGGSPVKSTILASGREVVGAQHCTSQNIIMRTRKHMQCLCRVVAVLHPTVMNIIMRYNTNARVVDPARLAKTGKKTHKKDISSHTNELITWRFRGLSDCKPTASTALSIACSSSICHVRGVRCTKVQALGSRCARLWFCKLGGLFQSGSYQTVISVRMI